MFGKHIYDSRGLNIIKRYQNRRMHCRPSVSEHLYGSSLCAQWLARLENDVFGNQCNIAEVLQRCVNHNLTQVATGNYLLEVKKFMPDKVRESEVEVFNNILKYDIPQSWVPDFERFILNAKDDSLEGRIVTASDLIDAMFECIDEIKLHNIEHFSNYLVDILDELCKINIRSVDFTLKMCLNEINFDFNRYISENVRNYINSIEFNENNLQDYTCYLRYVQSSRETSILLRYQHRRMFDRPSDSMHMWSVTKIAQGLARWQHYKFGVPVDMLVLMLKCINHDISEKETGDIPSPTKRMVPKMSSVLEETELVVFNKKIKYDIPKPYIEEYKGYILHPKDSTVEGKIMAAADTIDTMFESIEQIKLGNDEVFQPILKAVTESLMKIDLDCVRYFLKYSLTDFGLDIERYYGTKVHDFIRKLHFDDSVFLNISNKKGV